MKKYVDFSSPVFRRRLLMCLLGVVICAICVGLFKTAALGVDPFQSLMAGLDKAIPIQFGTLYVIVNAVLLIFSIVADRHYIGLATFINLFLLGYITEFSLKMFTKLLPNPGMPVRVICLIIAVIIICFGSALYMTADLGVSTYDAVALIIVNTWHKGQFKYVRIITDIICVILGCVLFVIAGGAIKDIPTIAGVGTIITAFFMGPVIEFFNDKFARPFLAKAQAKENK